MKKVRVVRYSGNKIPAGDGHFYGDMCSCDKCFDLWIGVVMGTVKLVKIKRKKS